MRASLIAATAALMIFAAILAPAEEPDLSSVRCPVAYPDRMDIYGHDHEVPVVAEPEPTNVVTDELALIGRSARLLCFGLMTTARNYHTCGFAGVARAVSRGRYVFTEGETMLRFTFLSRTRVRVEAVGEGYRESCGWHGTVERAVYDFRRKCTRSAASRRDPCPFL